MGAISRGNNAREFRVTNPLAALFFNESFERIRELATIEYALLCQQHAKCKDAVGHPVDHRGDVDPLADRMVQIVCHD